MQRHFHEELDALNARFRNHTVKLFERHGITSVGYFVPQDAPQSQNTLIYILAHKDRESAKQNWAAFQKDPEWQAVYEESSKNGPLQTQVLSVFMGPLDFSQLSTFIICTISIRLSPAYRTPGGPSTKADRTDPSST